MPKLLWVALPVLLAAALLAVQALRRRPPSRHALNVWSSLLLVAYVTTTAGLGIFWVANQQLPVFDWHYLFGYVTVLLVALHLSFNFRVVWRHLTRRRAAALPPASPRADAAPGRRGVLVAAGLLLSAGTAFVLGRRQGHNDGRSDVRSDGHTDMRSSGPDRAGTPADAGTAPDAAAGLALIERYHALTSHSRAGVFLRAPGTDWGDPPPAFKTYPGLPRVALPPPGAAPHRPLDGPLDRPLDLAALAAVLWHTAGVTATRGSLRLRASPSSGALFSTELYVAARSVGGLAPGLWHHDAQAHALERLQDGAPVDAALGLPVAASPRDDGAVIFLTAVFRRSGHKYRDRTYRYVLADLGHALENLRVAARATGAAVQVAHRFDEARVAAALGLDEQEEGVLALVSVRTATAAGATHDTGDGPIGSGGHWQVPPPPATPAPVLGVTGALHRATSLRAAVPAGPAVADAPPPAPPSPGSIGLPPAVAARANLLDVIAARRSVRRFTRTPLTLQAFSGVIAGLATTDAPGLSGAVRIHVVVHAVSGVPPGAYRLDAVRRTLAVRRANVDLRAAARAAALDQDVIGDAAAVFVLSIDRRVFAADPAGPARGYRHSLLEAGMVGERVYLEAGARGLGACAVGAFYDEEAAALVAIDPAREWVVHFAALGEAA